ncbi:signal transduction histidine-protein kinase BaeS [Lachnospiraceae bacterium]|nr:signal transduction histidine-protein kinase BaeS [Lachnospiraceae bacterium]
MIKKIKSRLSAKVFLLTLLLIAVCCFTTYSFILQAAPKNYQYDIEDVDLELSFLPDEFSRTEKEYAYMFLEAESDWIEEQYENEFALHFFQSDGQEVSLHDINQLVGGRITDFDKVEKTKPYTASFADSDSIYTLLVTRNTAKHTQTEEAIQGTLPVLCLVVLLGSIISAFFYSWYMTVPIKKVSKLSKKMADMDFSGFCPVGRADEIGVLSDSLNKLSRKLATTLSELQEANQKLQADIDMEKQLEKQRVEFFSAASHELKTPITIIKGQLQGMLYQVGRYKDRETYLAQSLEVTDTLEKMVQELLAISRLDTPGYTCKKCRLNLNKLIVDRITAFEDLFMQRDLTVEQFISPEIYILGDMQLLQKVLDNLLGNAAAYSEAGNNIIVNLWKEADNVGLTIENTGAHIPDEDIPKLFEAFYRVDQSRNRQTGGTGLGLYIVKTILDLHSAKIKIANTIQGVIVYVQF